MLERARIPKRYDKCTLNSFEFKNKTLATARVVANGFVDKYPFDTNGLGLLFVGPVGVGKTHLAIAVLRALILERGATGLFYDYRELLKQIQNSYDRNVATTEQRILKPIFDADVLLIDELGAERPSDWDWDMMSHILNTRYNDRRTTLITTNFPNAAPLGLDAKALVGVESERTPLYRKESLGDRIGERMRSRLQEMCVLVEMQGEDYRQTDRKAKFV